VYALRPPLLSTLVVTALLTSWACYRQPEIPRDRPLACASEDPEECPSGFVCVQNRVCAPEECETDEACPAGLVCGRMGCLPPGAELDGGADAPAGGGADLGGGS
jgi:hypothetical protein